MSRIRLVNGKLLECGQLISCQTRELNDFIAKVGGIPDREDEQRIQLRGMRGAEANQVMSERVANATAATLFTSVVLYPDFGS